MKINKLSIIIPVFNEEKTIGILLDQLTKLKLDKIKKQIIVVNDGSTDNSLKIIKQRISKNKNRNCEFVLINKKKNEGKGAAIKLGLKKTTGDYVLIQDGDLEYNPKDIKKMIDLVREKESEVVYGSRLLNKKRIKHGGSLFYYGGRLINILCNILYGINITDEATGYKMFKTKLLKSIPLESRGFEFCPEITAKIAKKKIPIFEVAISYKGRTKKEGKKIRLRDGLKAIYTLFKYKFVD